MFFKKKTVLESKLVKTIFWKTILKILFSKMIFNKNDSYIAVAIKNL